MEWDSEGQYTRERVEVYYLSHSAKPVGEDQLTEVLTCHPAAYNILNSLLFTLGKARRRGATHRGADVPHGSDRPASGAPSEECSCGTEWSA